MLNGQDGIQILKTMLLQKIGFFLYRLALTRPIFDVKLIFKSF